MIPEKISKNIEGQLEIIDSSIEWADKFGKESFSRADYKEYRRQVKKIRNSLAGRCSVAAYGESQVGKSYLMSSLLSSPSSPFVIVDNGKEYSFIDAINPSGGNTAKIESTGLITRFTVEKDPRTREGFVKASLFSVADMILMFADSYYSDLIINPRSVLSSAMINARLDSLSSIWKGNTEKQYYIEEDDVLDIRDYLSEVIGISASNVLQSDFFDIVSEAVKYIPVNKWVSVFGLLWNENDKINGLFSSMIGEMAKLSFNQEVLVPFSAVLRSEGTLLKIQWLDLVCGEEGKPEDFPVLTTDVYDMSCNLLSSGFSKAFLSACTSEITLTLPDNVLKERPFLAHTDLLDFPGARSRLHIPEAEIASVLPEIFRRGKVAYLFAKYSRMRRISSILFCHHNDQKTEPTIGESIKDWVEDVIGNTPKKRAENLANTGNVSPLFMIATKFNIDLSMQKVDSPGNLSNHWRRFTEVLPEIIGPYQWFDNWTETGGRRTPFQNIFPLRDFYWSGSSQSGMSYLFDGYCDGIKGATKSEELAVHQQTGYPNYFSELKASFMDNDFVKEHFENPERTWNDVATLNNDGSKAIIFKLNQIAPKLEKARENQYQDELMAILDRIKKSLEVYYEPDDDEAKSKKTKMITARIRARLFMSVGSNPEVFGKIIDSLMVEPVKFRKIARDILVLRKDTPKDFSAVNFLRANAGIDPADGKDVNMKKLLDFFGMFSKEELEEEFRGKDFSIDDVISGDTEFCSTMADVLTKHILDYWMTDLNRSVLALEKYLPFTDEVVLMFQRLVTMLGVKKRLSEKIELYDRMFGTDEKLNSIADYASLELNNFVSTIGRKYMTEEDIATIRDKALRCGIEVDLSSEGIEPVRKRQSVDEVLDALDASTGIMRQSGFSNADMEVLRHLPLWDNFQRWQNLLAIGLIYTSGVSTKDPRANQAVKQLLDKVDVLYA